MPGVNMIEFPLVAGIIVDYLNEPDPQYELASVPDQYGNSPVVCAVQSEIPNPRPPRMIAVFTLPTGAAERSKILSERRIACQVYEQSEYVTACLTEKVRALIVDIQYRQRGVHRVNVIGEPARWPGPGVPYRWQFTAEVMVRAIAGAWG